MARPRRPAAEVEAVCRAASLLMREIGSSPTQVIAREMARRVIAELIADVSGQNDDPLAAALMRFHRSPFTELATCAEIDTLSSFLDERIKRVRSRGGRYLNANEQLAERRDIESILERRLSQRYARHLRLAFQTGSFSD